jgi:hypothetical protein
MARTLASNSAASQNLRDSFRPNFVTVEVFCLGSTCGQ